MLRFPRAAVPEAPASAATVVPAERFAGETKGVAELVATAPGVAVREYGGLGQLSTVSVRGASANGVLVLLDGLPLGPPAGGAVDLSTVPRAWISRLEVVRGVEGAHFGAGALGGAVNVVTRGGEPGWSVEASGGTFGAFALAADGARPLGRLTLFAAATAEGAEGDFGYDLDPAPDLPGSPTEPRTRARNAYRRAGLLLKVGGPAGGGRADALVSLSGGRRELPGSAYALAEHDAMTDGRLLATARYARAAAPGLVLAGRLAARAERLDLELELGDARQRGLAGGAEVEARLVHSGEAGLLRVALETEGEALEAGGAGGTRRRATLAAALSEELVVLRGRLRLAPALRAERVGPFSGLSAKLGASLRLPGPFTARASAGRSFRAPSFGELYLRQGLVDPDPTLSPERGVGGDAALAAEGRAGFASVGGHLTLYDDLVVYRRVSFDRFRPANAARARVAGLEVEGATAPARRLAGLALQAAYTLLDTEQLRGTEDVLGNELPRRPRHRLYARASLSPGPVGLHAELHATSRQWQEPENVRAVPAALVWNAGASLRLARRPALALHLEARNLLDDRTLVDAFGYPLPGRSVMVTLRAGSPRTEGRP